MKGRMKVKTMLIGTFLLAVSLILPSQAFAWGWGRSHHRYPHHSQYPYGSFSLSLPNGSITVGFGKEKYYYQSGIFYRQHQLEYVVVPPPSGVIVYAIPVGFHKVIIDGDTYFTYNGVYYTRIAQGYRVVQPPASVVLEPATVESNVVSDTAQEGFTVNIPNSRGGYNAVSLKRSGNGYVGPQGEYYAEFPRVEQLKVMYGK